LGVDARAGHRAPAGRHPRRARRPGPRAMGHDRRPFAGRGLAQRPAHGARCLCRADSRGAGTRLCRCLRDRRRRRFGAQPDPYRRFDRRCHPGREPGPRRRRPGCPRHGRRRHPRPQRCGRIAPGRKGDAAHRARHAHDHRARRERTLPDQIADRGRPYADPDPRTGSTGRCAPPELRASRPPPT
jgi:hypothetical protein